MPVDVSIGLWSRWVFSATRTNHQHGFFFGSPKTIGGVLFRDSPEVLWR